MSKDSLASRRNLLAVSQYNQSEVKLFVLPSNKNMNMKGDGKTDLVVLEEDLDFGDILLSFKGGS